jgi:arylsulfatase A-like enzyme
MTPFERGFDSSFGNLGQVHHDFSSDRYCSIPGCEAGIDLWETQAPAYGAADEGQYSSQIFAEHIRKTIRHHNTSKPLFMYINPTQPHTPYVVPEKYSQPYLNAGRTNSFATYNGMITAVDDIVGTTVNMLKFRDMWSNTLFLYASDNGGLTCAADYAAGFASNYPLRGGKLNVLEGGVRTLAFVAGGFLPRAMRGKTLEGYIHLADWFTTFAGVAGAPQRSDPEGVLENGVPSVDGMDMWPYVSGRVAISPRSEVIISEFSPQKKKKKAALIQGEFKLVTSNGMVARFWRRKNLLAPGWFEKIMHSVGLKSPVCVRAIQHRLRLLRRICF